MTLFACASSWVVGRMPDLDEPRRSELASSVRELADDQGRLGRVTELASLGGLALQLRGRRLAHGDPVALVRMGAHLGGRLVLTAAAATALGGVAAGVTGTGPSTPGLVAAAAVGMALLPPLLALVQGRLPVLVSAGVGAAYLAAISAADLPVRPVGTMLAVAMAALAVGRPVGRPPSRGVAAAAGWAVPVLAVAAVAAGAGPEAADAAVHLSSTLLVPVALVVAGWFDPRYATAAGVVWLWRFLAADLGRVPHETVTVVGDLKASDLLLRLALMATGVVCAWAVARASLRRAALL